MIIKSFTAESAAAALKQVRHSMGGNAVVLKTRQITDQVGIPRVEVTALLDRPTVAQTEMVVRPRISGSDRQALTEETTSAAKPVTEQDQVVRYLKELFADQDFDRAYAHQLTQRATSHTSGISQAVVSLSDLLRADLGGLIARPPVFTGGDKVLFIGPAGSGKTSVLGKLAAELVFQKKQKVKLVSLDNQKIGANDEMHSYADLLGTAVGDSRQDSTMTNGSEDCITLIDSPALPTNSKKSQWLAEKTEALGVTHCVLVCSCLTRTADQLTLLENVTAFRPDYLAATGMDMTVRYGSILSVARTLDLKLAYMTNSPGGMGQLQTPDKDMITDSMLGGRNKP